MKNNNEKIERDMYGTALSVPTTWSAQVLTTKTKLPKSRKKYYLTIAVIVRDESPQSAERTYTIISQWRLCLDEKTPKDLTTTEMRKAERCANAINACLEHVYSLGVRKINVRELNAVAFRALNF
jgi:hypothetical protein